jgi:hypothetical protein
MRRRRRRCCQGRLMTAPRRRRSGCPGGSCSWRRRRWAPLPGQGSSACGGRGRSAPAPRRQRARHDCTIRSAPPTTAPPAARRPPEGRPDLVPRPAVFRMVAGPHQRHQQHHHQLQLLPLRLPGIRPAAGGEGHAAQGGERGRRHGRRAGGAAPPLEERGLLWGERALAAAAASVCCASCGTAAAVATAPPPPQAPPPSRWRTAAPLTPPPPARCARAARRWGPPRGTSWQWWQRRCTQVGPAGTWLAPWSSALPLDLTDSQAGPYCAPPPLPPAAAYTIQIQRALGPAGAGDTALFFGALGAATAVGLAPLLAAAWGLWGALDLSNVTAPALGLACLNGAPPGGVRLCLPSSSATPADRLPAPPTLAQPSALPPGSLLTPPPPPPHRAPAPPRPRGAGLRNRRLPLGARRAAARANTSNAWT